MRKMICILSVIVLAASLMGCSGTQSQVDLSGKDLITSAATEHTAETTALSEGQSEEASSAEEETSSAEQETEPVVIVSNEESGDYQIGVLSDGNCTIIGYGGSDSVIEIPEKLDGRTVVSIGEKAFSENKNIETLVIPGCVREIGEEAFSLCENLTSLTLNEGLEYIGEHAFFGCEKLTEAVIPDSVKKICGFAFKGCGGLKKLKLPSGLEAIEHCTFAGCSSLENVEIPDSVKSIGAWAFAWTAWEEGLIAEAGEWLELGNGAAYIYNGSASEVTVPAEYETYEFDCNGDIKKITISEGITSIPPYSCELMSGLEEIIIPSTIKSVGECAFRNTKVGEMNFSDGLERIEKSAFENAGNVILHLPDSVNYIDEEAFAGCESVLLVCSPGSYAEQFANDHGFSASAE